MAKKAAPEPEPTLYSCTPDYWKRCPKSVRYVFGWLYLIYFTFTFLAIPFCVVFIIPYSWKYFPISATIGLCLVVGSMLLPSREWPIFRKVGQLWYEIFQFSSNLSPEKRKEIIQYGDDHQLIIAMHPHGIVPFQAVLWAAYCDQYMSDESKGKNLYGFGAAADVVGYIPFLRNIMGWLTAGSATYGVLKDGITKGKCAAANRAGRTPKNLFLLPGGIAEVFTSKPGSHSIVLKERRGLMKLSIETGAELVPAYVFGGTDFFENLATGDNIFSRVSRKLRMGVTLFWGPFGLPVPYTPKVTLVIGEPIVPPKWDSAKGKIPKELVDGLHARFLNDMTEMFDKYKEVAGYKDAVLDIQ